MKILINDCYGGFRFSNKFIKAFPQFEDYEWGDFKRDDKAVISAVESFGIENAQDDGIETSLAFVEIPDDSTDYTIINNGYGEESVLYVLDGKIYYGYA